MSTSVTTARSHSLGDLIDRSARRHPDKLALVDVASDVRLTFAEVGAAVARLAAAFDQRGLERGDVVVLLSHNCWQFPVVILAAARRGIIVTPVNFMLSAPEVAYVLEHSGATAVIVEDDLIPVASDALTRVSDPGRVTTIGIGLASGALPPGWLDLDALIAYNGPQPEPVVVHDDDPIRIMYTSGTESKPKGAVLSSRSLMTQYASCIVSGGMAPTDVEVHALPLYHCAQLDNFLMTDLQLGATSFILRRPDPAMILTTIAREKVTNLFCPPTVWIQLLQQPEFDTLDITSLSKGYYGASAMPTEVLDTLTSRLPELSLWNFYGQTEMASLATVLPPDEQRSHQGSAGYPALNVQTAILDDDDHPLAQGEVGEIAHRSSHLTLGYLNDAERTDDAFRSGWFHSGDLGYFDEGGRLYVVDRRKDMIKTGGENVSSREVEEVLFTHPDVSEVAVFGVPDPRWIEAIVAAVVPRGGRVIDEAVLIGFCREHLAGFKTPKRIVSVTELPRNPSGKILKRSLRDSFSVDLSTETITRIAPR